MKENIHLPSLKNGHQYHHSDDGGGGINGKIINSSRPPSSATAITSATRIVFRLLPWFMVFLTMTYLVYSLKLHLSFPPCSSSSAPHGLSFPITNVAHSVGVSDEPTSVQHVVFGIAASSRLWVKRKEYLKLWWRPRQTRGVVWLDKAVKTRPSEERLLPPIKISGNTTSFAYTHRRGHRSAIRISRIVAETLRLGLPNVRWFVMGDDDTVFLVKNLIDVLSCFDHRQYYYIGGISETHLQNIHFSFGMAYGGGGFAISYPLAAALTRIQDQCIERYAGLYGSDDRMQACMSELGVPLTRHPGFHQYDVHGNLFGLLAAHPVAPLVTLHHLDVVEPVFPNETRVGALRRIFQGPAKLDPAAVMQQSICYDAEMNWTISVSWGFAVQVFRGFMTPREMEMPARTFLNWQRRSDYTGYSLNTRPVARIPCQRPVVYYLRSSTFDQEKNTTVTNYGPGQMLGGGGTLNSICSWKIDDPMKMVDVVTVHKCPDPLLWNRSPRRNCCRVLKDEEGRRERRTMTIDVGLCEDGEIRGT